MNKKELKGKWEDIKDNVKSTFHKVADTEKIGKVKEDLTKTAKVKLTNVKKDITGKV